MVALRAREAALPVPAPAAQVVADAGRLSAAMVQALAGGGDGEPAEFPLDYLRRCTHGFHAAHLEGEGAFGSVFRAVDPVYVHFGLESGHLCARPALRLAAHTTSGASCLRTVFGVR